MEFKPLNNSFFSYETSKDHSATVITPRLFTRIIQERSRLISTGIMPPGGTVANNYFISQIDMSEPNAFTLGMMDFKDWHTAMQDLS